MRAFPREAGRDAAALREERVQLRDEPGIQLVGSVAPYHWGTSDQEGRRELAQCVLPAGLRAVGLLVLLHDIGETSGPLSKLLLQKVERGLSIEGLAQRLAFFLIWTQLAAQERLGNGHHLLVVSVKPLHHLVGDLNARGQVLIPFAVRREMGLPNHVVPVERLPEELRREVRDELLRVLLFPALHRGARGNAPELAGRAGMLLQPTDQARHIRAAVAGIRVNLVENEELENPLVFGREENPVLEPGEEKLQHDVVRHEDVRRRLLDLLPADDLAVEGLLAAGDLPEGLQGFLLPLEGIACVAGQFESRASQATRKVVVLGVGQSIHRVHDDRFDARGPPLAGPQAFAHDRDAEGKGLPGAGARGNDRVVAGLDGANGLGLVLVGPDRLGLPITGLGREALRGVRVDVPFFHKVAELGAALEAAVELNKRVPPQKRPLVDPLADPFFDLGISELLKSVDVGPIGVLDVGEDVEGIHESTNAQKLNYEKRTRTNLQ